VPAIDALVAVLALVGPVVVGGSVGYWLGGTPTGVVAALGGGVLLTFGGRGSLERGNVASFRGRGLP
jgi:hypothetical protein